MNDKFKLCSARVAVLVVLATTILACQQEELVNTEEAPKLTWLQIADSAFLQIFTPDGGERVAVVSSTSTNICARLKGRETFSNERLLFTVVQTLVGNHGVLPRVGTYILKPMAQASTPVTGINSVFVSVDAAGNATGIFESPKTGSFLVNTFVPNDKLSGTVRFSVDTTTQETVVGDINASYCNADADDFWATFSKLTQPASTAMRLCQKASSCPNDNDLAPDYASTCEASLNPNALCSTEYRALLECYQAHPMCNEAGETDTQAMASACAVQMHAMAACSGI